MIVDETVQFWLESRIMGAVFDRIQWRKPLRTRLLKLLFLLLMSCFKPLGLVLLCPFHRISCLLPICSSITYLGSVLWNSEFGAKVVPPKRILKMLPELFDHQDQNVRASSKGLTLELCRWIGKDVVKSILFEKMRDTMVLLIKEINY